MKHFLFPFNYGFSVYFFFCDLSHFDKNAADFMGLRDVVCN